MVWFGIFALIVWLPVVFFIFERYPVQKAVVFSFVFAWLFLPSLQLAMSGFPDWTKMTATVFSICLVACLKHTQRLFSIKIRWYDLPVLIFCFCPMVSAVLNNQGVYDGLSAILDELFRWGLPYLIGRLFLADARGNRQLCLGIAVGGLVYVPLCLFELRMSPVIKMRVYGFVERPTLDFGLRYGGYRPMVFLSSGLELGWWMCCASLAAFNLWRGGAVKRLAGLPMSVLTVGMMLVTVACKATGALVLISLGLLVILFSRLTKTRVLVWTLILIPPFYCVTRPLGLWTGQGMVGVAGAVFGLDRAQSLEYRFMQEEVLMRSAMQSPLYGWARHGGFNPIGPNGYSAVLDGFWIIVFGAKGFIGLTALNGMLLVPTVLFIRRFPPREWLDPDVAPVTTLAMILPLYMIDNISNSMLNPIYAVAMGAVSGFLPSRSPASSRRTADSKSKSYGSSGQGALAAIAERSFPGHLTHDQAGDFYEAEATASLGDDDDATWELYSRCAQRRVAAVTIQATPARLDRLARTHVLIARFLTGIDQPRAAIQEREQALSVWATLLNRPEPTPFSRDLYVTNLNDLAWLLVADRQGEATQYDRAQALAEEAVQAEPDQASSWNTLGIAYYRRRDFYKAIHALSQSVSLSPSGGTAFDFYYLALANHALGYAQLTTDWLDRAEAWVHQHPGLADRLAAARAEIAEVAQQS